MLAVFKRNLTVSLITKLNITQIRAVGGSGSGDVMVLADMFPSSREHEVRLMAHAVLLLFASVGI